MTQNNLGNVLLAQAEQSSDPVVLAAAVEAYRHVLEVRTEAEAPLRWAETQNNLANALSRQGQLSREPLILREAVAAYRRALRVYTKAEAPRHWAVCQNNLGNALCMESELSSDSGLLAAGAEAYSRALEVYDAERTPVDYLAIARALGWALLRQQAWPEVIKELDSLLAAGIALVFAEPTRQRQRVLLERLSGVGDDLAAAWLARGNTAAAVDALGRGRAIVLNLMAAIARAGEQPELQHARSQWRAAQSAADKVEERERTAAPAQLDEASATASKAREAVHASYLHFRELLKAAGLDAPPAVDCAELAAAVPAGGALVMPILASHANARVLVLAAGSDKPEEVPRIEGVTSDWLADRLGAWFAGYAAFGNAAQAKGHVDDGDIAAWNQVMATVLTGLGEVLMAPVDQFLRDQMKLAADAEIVLMLPGRLSPLPLHAAPVNAAGEVFLDHWVVRQVASPHQLLAGNAALAARNHGRPTLLAVTNPTADQALGRQPNPALPFFAEDARIELREGEAKVERVKQAAQSKEPGWTHYSFFCHGAWDHTNPERSGLQMNDDMFSVAEFRDLNLSASRFAMIAACETALHDLNRIPDEFANVPMALAESGIPCVAASLWPVGVGPTRQLVEGVFRRLIEKNMPPALALRAAQFELRGKDWRFGPVLGWGSRGAAEPAPADHPAPGGQEPATDAKAGAAPAPDLFSWAGFACFGG
jgi:tetratricopeptide (TPR) repeat protein